MAKKNENKVQEAILVDVVYSVDHGNYSKGDKSKMHPSTAKAMVKHKIVSISK